MSGTRQGPPPPQYQLTRGDKEGKKRTVGRTDPKPPPTTKNPPPGANEPLQQGRRIPGEDAKLSRLPKDRRRKDGIRHRKHDTIYVSTPKIKGLGVKQTKYVGDLREENYGARTEEINRINAELIPVHGQEAQYRRDVSAAQIDRQI